MFSSDSIFVDSERGRLYLFIPSASGVTTLGYYDLYSNKWVVVNTVGAYKSAYVSRKPIIQYSGNDLYYSNSLSSVTTIALISGQTPALSVTGNSLIKIPDMVEVTNTMNNADAVQIDNDRTLIMFNIGKSDVPVNRYAIVPTATLTCNNLIANGKQFLIMQEGQSLYDVWSSCLIQESAVVIDSVTFEAKAYIPYALHSDFMWANTSSVLRYFSTDKLYTAKNPTYIFGGSSLYIQ